MSSTQDVNLLPLHGITVVDESKLQSVVKAAESLLNLAMMFWLCTHTRENDLMSETQHKLCP